jgi:hypothetical protein
VYTFDFALILASEFAGDLTSRAHDFDRDPRRSFREASRTEWQHLAECALRGLPSECTFHDGRGALEIVLAAVDSVRSGHPLDINRHGRAHEGGRSPG